MAKVLFIILFSHFARAEYRAYVLAISREGNTRQVITNFDPTQYIGIYSLNEGETVELVDSWMCWGSQGEGIPICSNPKNPEQTSSTEDPNSSPSY